MSTKCSDAQPMGKYELSHEENKNSRNVMDAYDMAVLH